MRDQVSVRIFGRAMRYAACLSLAGVGTLLSVSAALAQNAAKTALPPTSGSRQTPAAEPEISALKVDAVWLLDLFAQRPEMLVDVKNWIADELTAEGSPILASSITDEQLFARVNVDARLRVAIVLHLRTRGYRDIIDAREDVTQSASRHDVESADPARSSSADGAVSPSALTTSEPERNWESAFLPSIQPSVQAGEGAELSGGVSAMQLGAGPLAAFARAREQSADAPFTLGSADSSLRSAAGVEVRDAQPRPAGVSGSATNAPLTKRFSQDGTSTTPGPEVLHEETPYNLLALRDLYTQVAQASRPLERFGTNALRATLQQDQRSALDQPVGSTYILGSGDRLRVGISGPLAQAVQQTIDSGGRIAVPAIGTVEVVGLTIEAAERLLSQRLAGQYRNAVVDLSVVRTRTVRVYVVGDVQLPGAYDVPSQSTPLSAVYAAGGPSASGSYRKLEHLRAGRVIESVDLYDLLLFGRLHTLLPLAEGDTIRVPPAGPQITVAGRVRRPAVYEVLAGATVSDAVQLAAGLLPDAKASDTTLSRIDSNGSRQSLSVVQEELHPGAASRLIQDGDILQIGAIAPWSESSVYLEGHVAFPGKKPYRDGMTLHDLLPGYRDLLPEPADRGEIIRLEAPEMKPVSVPFSVAAEMSGREAIKLQPFDTVRIRGRYDSDAPKVTVRGEVQKPGEYPLSEGMTVAGLVELAGGFTRSALLSEADLASYQVQDEHAVMSERTTLAIGAIVRKQPGVDSVALKPGDVLTVHQISGWNDIGASVKLQGEFEYPGTFGLQPGERLSSVLKRAGGFRNTAYPAGAVLLRVQVREFEERTRQDLIHQIESTSVSSRLGVNASGQDESSTLQLLIQQQEQVLQRLRTQHATGRMVVHLSPDVASWEGTSADIELRAGDVLVVPKRPGFVLVSGQVYNQSAQTFTPNKTADWYLQHAGGATEMAETKEIFIVRANGEVIGRRSNGGSEHVLKTKLDAGDVIVVPQKFIGGSMFWRNMLTTAQLFSSIAIPLAIAGV